MLVFPKYVGLSNLDAKHLKEKGFLIVFFSSQMFHTKDITSKFKYIYHIEVK